MLCTVHMAFVRLTAVLWQAMDEAEKQDLVASMTHLIVDSGHGPELRCIFDFYCAYAEAPPARKPRTLLQRPMG